MRKSLPLVASLGMCVALVGGAAYAQTPEELACAKTRAEVRGECVQFLKTHVWNDGAGTYVLKQGANPPEGVATRAQIVAERNKFLAANRWNDAKSMWEPIAGKPRDISAMPAECTLSRGEMQKECNAFMKTHRWDDAKGAYVPAK